MKTLKELAQEALDVQNACNLCGVVQSFARAMIDLGPHLAGTEDRNTHFITRAWVDKLVSLSRLNQKSYAQLWVDVEALAHSNEEDICPHCHTRRWFRQYDKHGIYAGRYCDECFKTKFKHDYPDENERIDPLEIPF